MINLQEESVVSFAQTVTFYSYIHEDDVSLVLTSVIKGMLILLPAYYFLLKSPRSLYSLVSEVRIKVHGSALRFSFNFLYQEKKRRNTEEGIYKLPAHRRGRYELSPA